MGFLSPQQRAALAASSQADAGGAPLSSFSSPPTSAGKADRLWRLASSESPRIRESAALAHRAPAGLLRVLAADPDPGVRRCVARNEASSEDVLRSLAADPDPLVRGWVAANPAVPGDLLPALAGDEEAQVRAVVAWAERWES